MTVSKAWHTLCRISKQTYLTSLPILILLMVFVGCSDEQPKKPKWQNFKQSGDFVEFKLGKENFKIRKAYFKGGGESRWGLLFYAKFWALLPDFETYDRAKNGYEFVERLGWGRKLYFQMHLREKDRNAVAAIVEHNKGKNGGLRFSGRLGTPDELIYGLELYRATNYSPDEYLYRPDGGMIVYISCSSKIMNTPSPSCKMMLPWN